MNAELAARITAARAVDADCTAVVDRHIDAGGPAPAWEEFYYRISSELRAVLGALEQQQ